MDLSMIDVDPARRVTSADVAHLRPDNPREVYTLGWSERRQMLLPPQPVVPEQRAAGTPRTVRAEVERMWNTDGRDAAWAYVQRMARYDVGNYLPAVEAFRRLDGAA